MQNKENFTFELVKYSYFSHILFNKDKIKKIKCFLKKEKKWMKKCHGKNIHLTHY